MRYNSFDSHICIAYMYIKASLATSTKKLVSAVLRGKDKGIKCVLISVVQNKLVVTSHLH